VQALAALGHRVEVIGQERRFAVLPRHAVWRRAVLPWPLDCPVSHGSPNPAYGFRYAPQAFRAAQVHFDLYGHPARLADPDPPDIMHWTTPLPLHWPGRPNIHTVHDLIRLRDAGRRWRRILQAALARSAHILAVSETVRHEVIAEFGLSPDRVTTLYQPLDLPTPAAASPLGPNPGLYDLFVGTADPRKNLPRVMSAHAASGVPGRLVVAGLGPSAIPSPPGVLCMPPLDRRDLVRLIVDARMMLLPSLAEGFGLPVAEAMALGVPVITAAGGGALAEIAGGAAMLVDPTDVAAIAAAIATVAADPALRARMAANGRARATLFDAAQFADRLDTVLTSTMAVWRQDSKRRQG
jgi:glycosyltransferase involved in cell wall biosynthesis